MQLQVLYDIYESKRAGEDFTLFTLDDVDEAFETKTGERFVQLKYSQHYNLTGTQ
jgi:cleavage and polyadenylation specificity factor subunit 2